MENLWLETGENTFTITFVRTETPSYPIVLRINESVAFFPSHLCRSQLLYARGIRTKRQAHPSQTAEPRRATILEFLYV
ncbi:hypothetical protein GJ744_011480 [Endocarpon pusillum]|uniref:Uncharacterized protein n=1 Tax=Endocarpon pusillum TaxID=364733 RepID=A0A8H7E4V0_9EURO|nr:hypothetical protein GJ744_011480 [Endocarpon pusillum]